MFDLTENKNQNIKNDVLSGITVALALVPEAIAFAFVAGVSPLVGIHTAFIIGLLTAILGGRPGMISGATGAIAVVFVALVSTHGIEYLFPAVILMGLIQVVAGVLRLGKFSRFIPYPVMLGFVNGLAIVIFRSQLQLFKGLSGGLLILMLSLVVLTMLIIVFFPKLTKTVPSTLVGIIVVTVIAVILEKNGIHLNTVKDFAGGEIKGTLPVFHLPTVPLTLDTLKIILPFAFTAAMVGLIESLLTLNLIDEITDTRGRSNKECVGQGVANVVTGLFGGMGGCAMIGQSMINIGSGGRKRLSGITAAVALLVFVMFASKLISIIPLAALVGVMFMVVIGTFEWETLKFGKKIPYKDIAIIFTVAFVTVIHDLALGVGIGIIFSALRFAWEKGKEISVTEYTDEKNRKIYELKGSVFFGSVSNFKNLFKFKEDPAEVIIEFKNSKIMDHSAIEALNFITEKYKENKKTLHLKHLSHDCRQLLKNAEKIIEVNITEDPHYHIADDKLE